MSRRKPEPLNIEIPDLPNAATQEAMENQLIALAYQSARQRLINGTASSQEIVHFLKMGSIRQQAELEKLKKENELLVAKTEAIRSDAASGELYAQAIAAMKSYQPTGEDDEDEDDYYPYLR